MSFRKILPPINSVDALCKAATATALADRAKAIGDIAACKKYRRQAYLFNNWEKFKAVSLERFSNNAAHFRSKSRLWKKRNKEKNSAITKAWRAQNKAHLKEYDRKRRQLLKANVEHRLCRRFRCSLSLALKRNKAVRPGRSLKLLGCSIAFFKKYLEDQFLPGMTWGNRSLYGWHIDHKIPVSSFDLRDAAQVKTCFHYANHQPLWALDNLRKGCKTA